MAQIFIVLSIFFALCFLFLERDRTQVMRKIIVLFLTQLKTPLFQVLLLATQTELQSRTKLLEKVFPIISTFLSNKTISKTTSLRKESPFRQFNVASHKRPGIRLSFEYTTTLLSGEGGEGRTGTATMFRKMLSKYTIFSTVLSKIVGPSVKQRRNPCSGPPPV